MKHIAVIFEGRIDQRMGVFNAVINRVKHLQAIAPYRVDVYMIQVYDGWLMRQLRRTPKTVRPATFIDQGIHIKMLWYKRSWADSLRHRLLKRQPRNFLRWCSAMAWKLRGYDLVTAHDRLAGHMAAMAGTQLSIPHFITWHGGSINTDPFHDTVVMQSTRRLLAGARCNFGVSNALCHVARQIEPSCVIAPLYNGASSEFHPYTAVQRHALRQRYGLNADTRVVIFVGRLDEDKKAFLLPDIFHHIQATYDGSLTFWTVGDGPLADTVARSLAERLDPGLYTMWGKQDPSVIPHLLNCADVLVLPSRMEGLPLVAIEAIACGCNVVATRVGGTPEVVGEENTVAVDDDLVPNMARRAVTMLQHHVEQSLPPAIDWRATAQAENEHYLQAMAR